MPFPSPAAAAPAANASGRADAADGGTGGGTGPTDTAAAGGAEGPSAAACNGVVLTVAAVTMQLRLRRDVPDDYSDKAPFLGSCLHPDLYLQYLQVRR